MARHNRRPQRKRRTREHIDADLAVNHVERLILECGYSVERVGRDYGIDLVMFTYDEAGEIDNLDVRLQIRARRKLPVLADNETISVPVEVRHLNHWLREVSPFILVVCNAETRDEAYWVYTQRLFADPEWKEKWADASPAGTMVVHVPRANRLDLRAIREFRDFRDRIVGQLDGGIWHGSDD